MLCEGSEVTGLKRLDVWEARREQMPVTRNYSYFDHAAVAPISAPARLAITRWMNQACDEGDVSWLEWAERIETIRKRACQLFAAKTEEIAFVSNTTEAIGFVAEGFPWKAGDNIVLPEGEFPSNSLPWKHLASRGVEVRLVPLQHGVPSLASIDRACDHRTKIVALSWVGFVNGFRIDPVQAAEVAHRHGALLFLDAIQGMGVFPLDLTNSEIDFAAADGHKWMLGPEGAGLFYMRQKHLDLLRPMKVGWNSVQAGHDFSRSDLNFRPSVARYEGGSQNMVGAIGLGASLDMLADWGLQPNQSTLADRVLELVGCAKELLERAGANVYLPSAQENRSGILTFTMPGADPHQLRKQMLAEGVVSSVRADRNRLSIHAYNNLGDLERLAQSLR